MIDITNKMLHMIACTYDIKYADIRLACYDAEKFGIGGIIMMPNQIPVVRSEFPKTKMIAVSGYPAGCQPFQSKVVEIREAAELGADEVFLVPRSGLVLDDQWSEVKEELTEAKKAAGDKPIILMLEFAVFDDTHCQKLCLLAKECGYKGIATSAGFPHNSIFSISDPLALATLVCSTEPDYVRKIRSWIGPEMEIIAVDANLTCQKSYELSDAGADRIASSRIMEIHK